VSFLPDFRLETYFSRWEFTARYHLTASDAESMPMHELLALADDEDRSAWEDLRLGYTQTWGDPGLRAAIAGTFETIAPEDSACQRVRSYCRVAFDCGAGRTERSAHEAECGPSRPMV